MSATDRLAVTVFEDTGATIMARIYGNAGTAITQASLSAIVCKVYDLTDNTLIATRTLTISAVVFDSLQTSDPRWTQDTTGYNFLDAAPATCFPSGGRTYRLEYVFTPASGAAFAMVAEVNTLNLLSS